MLLAGACLNLPNWDEFGANQAPANQAPVEAIAPTYDNVFNQQ
jgi:hypothetical protein